MNSALSLFTERGYANTSVEDIAARAGISKGAVYLYFPSKQAILEGLITRAITPMKSQAFEEAAAHIDDVPAALRKLLTIMGQRLSDPGVVAIPKIVVREAVNAPEIAEMYQRAVLRHAVPALAAIIQKGVET
ncbi:MAG: TetR/AcrR family transcriptional regulator, partial [Paracoccaceae bacterium]|nr:TetR/AcrR family transcriptional regulator [Paracoccaceae bacterium]